jgi:hypothetical protein
LERLPDRDYVVREAHCPEEFRELYSELGTLSTDRVIVVHDISDVGRTGVLCKWLEESSESRVLCLASRDNVDAVLLSRFTRVVKDGSVQRVPRDTLAESAHAGTLFVDACSRGFDMRAADAASRSRFAAPLARVLESGDG